MRRKLEKTIANSATIDMKLDQSIQSEVLQWKLILVRLLDITLFLAERASLLEESLKSLVIHTMVCSLAFG